MALGPRQWKKDLARDRSLSLQGWAVLYFCWDDIVLSPESVIAEIRELIHVRRHVGDKTG